MRNYVLWDTRTNRPWNTSAGQTFRTAGEALAWARKLYPHTAPYLEVC